MATSTITVPIALSDRPEATITLPWFVQRTEYAPAPAAFAPLVNGEEAFGAVYDAIVAARHTVDIVCWGFQPSMYFKRGAAGQNALPIGQLLAQKAAEGVLVRLLCWQDGLRVAQWGENMAPGSNLQTAVESGLSGMARLAQRLGWQRGATWLDGKVTDPQKQFQRDFDVEWYRRADLGNMTGGRVPVPSSGAFANLQFATRDFDLHNRVEIAFRTALHGADDTRSSGTKAKNALSMGIAEPTHHQKMVLVDIGDPDHAVGFVMGHNMLDEYWDTDQHSSTRLHPAMGRSGWHPRQDISSRVSGPILADLNTNFFTAWDAATGQNLGSDRAGMPPAFLRMRAGDAPVMAQILRTQSQEGKRDIETLYLQTANNATRFIYLENQYFRWRPLVDTIKGLVQAYANGGRSTPLYLFVVTNASEAGISDGTVNTYRMLDALGRADTLPVVAKAERADELAAQRRDLVQELTWEQASAPMSAQAIASFDPASAFAKEQQQRLAAHTARTQALQQQIDAVDRQITDNAQGTIAAVAIEGLKVCVCSLVAPDSPPGQPWEDVYVHAKLMIVDDVFMTLGSANLNTRSMEADSELNICHEHISVTQPLRQRLWGIHTRGLHNATSDDPEQAFKGWGRIIDQNNRRRKSNQTPGNAPQAPYASLVEFHYPGATRSRMD